MATIEELDELSVEIINGLVGEDEELNESTSSPARAQRQETENADASVALSSSKALDEDSDDEDDVNSDYFLEFKTTIHSLCSLLYRTLMKQ